MKKLMMYSFIIVIRLSIEIPMAILFFFLYFHKGTSGDVPEIVYLILTKLSSYITVPDFFLYLFVQHEVRSDMWDVIFNAGIFLAFCAVHSIMARNMTKKILAKIFDEDFIRPVFIVTAGISLTTLIYLWRPIAGTLWVTHGVLYWIISILYCVSIGLMLLSVTQFDYLDYLGIRAILRKLHSEPTKPYRFTSKGFYSHCRHPMYLFIIISFWLAPVMTYARLEFAVLGTLYFILGTFLEEKNLRQELGVDYDRYRKNVPMWIPRLTPWKPDEGQNISMN